MTEPELATCRRCGGAGQVVVRINWDGTQIVERCQDCDGTGEVEVEYLSEQD